MVWDVVEACRQFKGCEAKKIASRDKGRHCLSDGIAKEGIQKCSRHQDNNLTKMFSIYGTKCMSCYESLVHCVSRAMQLWFVEFTLSLVIISAAAAAKSNSAF